MKKILLINGSPRKNGQTAALLNIFKLEIEKISQENPNGTMCNILHLCDYEISHCSGCDSCLRKPNKCPLSEKDDMQKMEEELVSADAIIMGAPSYFNSPPGIIKDLIDRTRPLKMAKYKLKDKIFASISSAGLRGGGNVPIHTALMRYALIQGMIVVAAIGHPVLNANFPGATLQKEGIKEFRQPSDVGEVSTANTQALAKRISNLLIKF